MNERHGIPVAARWLGVTILCATAAPALAASNLTIGGFERSAVVTDGQTLILSGTLGVEVLNVGDASTGTGFQVTAFEDGDGDGALGPGDTVLGTASAPPVAAGGTTAVAVPLSGTVAFAGNLVFAFVDSAGAIAEDDETDNVDDTGSLSVIETPPPSSALNTVLEWGWGAGIAGATPAVTAPTAINVMNTPAIVDLDGDGFPEVVFAATASAGGGLTEPGFLRALNGAGGAEVFTVTDPGLQVAASCSVAVGDIDGDGRPEIIACTAAGTGLIAFEHDGTFKWRRDGLEVNYWGGAAIADIDEDGTPEIVMGRQVLNADGTLRFTASVPTKGSQGTVGPLSLVADVDVDGDPEIVAGSSVASATGAQELRFPIGDGYPAVGNFDTDPQAEVVIVTGGSVWLFDGLTGATEWGPVSIPGGGAGGPPTVADYDNDGQPEIGVAGAARYAVFETDGTERWAAVTQDASSNRTGSSVFDFQGDGIAEVVYRDERFLRIYRGTDGTVLFEVPMSSCTWHEYVNVADVDGDGKAEIVAVANNNCGFGPQRGVFVYGAADDDWVATRPVWNQHTYHITNVGPDGSIPTEEVNNWLVDDLNNYRLNTFAPGEAEDEDLPDLVPSLLRFDQSACPAVVTVTARVGNGGALLAPAGVEVAFYDGDPSAGGALIGVATTPSVLQPGAFADVSVPLSPAPVGASLTVYVVADDDGTGTGRIREGFEDNNVHSAPSPVLCARCDVDANGQVDLFDVRAIAAARNQPALPGDPRDNDGDGVITVLDARQCVLLCTNARCAP
jgi:hypothetical protein